jgi:hypothetical protein
MPENNIEGIVMRMLQRKAPGKVMSTISRGTGTSNGASSLSPMIREGICRVR